MNTTETLGSDSLFSGEEPYTNNHQNHQNSTPEKGEFGRMTGAELYMAALAISLVIAVQRIQQEQQLFNDALTAMQAEREQQRAPRPGGYQFEGFSTHTRPSALEDYFRQQTARHQAFTEGLHGSFGGRKASDFVSNNELFDDAMHSYRQDSLHNTFNIGDTSSAPEASQEPRNLADTAPVPFNFAPLSSTKNPEDRQKFNEARDLAEQTVREQLKEAGWDGRNSSDDLRKQALRKSMMQLHSDTAEGGGNGAAREEAARLLTTEFDKAKRQKAQAATDGTQQAA